jgi:hypothetical protein
MGKGDKGRCRRGGIGLLWLVVGSIFGLLLGGCDERERITYPTPNDGVGPVTMIDQPAGADTTVPEGADFFVSGRTIDPDGVDTVYFLVTGGNQSFQPLWLDPPLDTVHFGLPLSTSGRSGDTILVEIHGVDTQGNHGTASHRQVVVQ